MTGLQLGVLLVDAGERAAVAACRSLAQAGYRVGTASSQWPAPASWSRCSERRFSLPNPRLDPAAFAGRVGEIAAAHRYSTALPCSEGALWAISGNREALPGGDFRLGMPDAATVERCTSKEGLLEAAAGAGLAAPRTRRCVDRDEALAAAEELGFPLVIKPRSTVFGEPGEARHRASSIAADPEALRAKLEEAGWPCLLQALERGTIVSLGGVVAKGRLLAIACSRYLRTWPADAGPVCFSRSIDPPTGLVEASGRLVGALDWEGIFELELVQREDGQLAVLDFNPRVYGSLALAVRAGAPLPAIWCDWLLRGRETRSRAAAGAFYRWEDADVRYAIRCLRSGDLRRAASVLRPRRRVAHPYLRWDDPLPMLVRGLAILPGFGSSESSADRFRLALRRRRAAP